jgi:hypothetical protein
MTRLLSLGQSQRYLSSKLRAHAASETLATPVVKFASDDVQPDFGRNENMFYYVLSDSVYLSQDRFNRPAGTGLFSS